MSMITIYSSPNCHFCKKAKMMLDHRKMAYSEVLCDTVEKKEEIKGMFPNARTFPIIIIDGKYIGGSTDLDQYLLEKDMNGMGL